MISMHSYLNTPVVFAVIGIASPLLASIFLYDGWKQIRQRAKELDESGGKEKARLVKEKDVLNAKDRALKILEEEIKAKENELDRKEEELLSLKKSLEDQSIDVSRRESNVGEREALVSQREIDLDEREDAMSKKEDTLAEREIALRGTVEPELEEEQAEDTTQSVGEKEKRRKMIEEELANILKETEEVELEEEIEPETKEALATAAMKICYLKKFYDVMSDRLIYFPSVIQTIVDYSLIEEAEKYYFDEDDELPMEYTVSIRSTATEKLGDDADMDLEYMGPLSLDVEI